jgi:hypothetical protein
MSAPTLDVFSLRESIVNEYKHFATSFTTIHANDIREQVEAIYAQNRYWPEPLIQINPSYKRSTDISKRQTYLQRPRFLALSARARSWLFGAKRGQHAEGDVSPLRDYGGKVTAFSVKF